MSSLKEFLGLTGYYRKFIRSYGQMAVPLTSLLIKEAFQWSIEATKAFEQLKQAITSRPPQLSLPNFSHKFVIECDACSVEVGVVLMQNHKPILSLVRLLKKKNYSLPPNNRSYWPW